MGKPIWGKWANDHDSAQLQGSASLAAARPATRPPGPWRQYPSSPEGWGVKMVTLWNSHTVIVKQSTINSPHIKLSMRSDLKTSKLAHYLSLWCHWKLNCQVCHFCGYFPIPFVGHSHRYSWFITSTVPIVIRNPHHYWNVVYRQHWFLRRLNL